MLHAVRCHGLVCTPGQAGELGRARAVAQRALQRINYRLEEERLNIFLAWWVGEQEKQKKQKKQEEQEEQKQ